MREKASAAGYASRNSPLMSAAKLGKTWNPAYAVKGFSNAVRTGVPAHDHRSF